MDITRYAIQKKMFGGGGGGVTPSGTIEITENGTHDVTQYASANVNVQASGGENKLAQLMNGSIKEITLQDWGSETVKLRKCAFAGTKLERIELPPLSDGLIPQNAFESCLYLKSFTVPNGTKKLDYDSFDSCQNLETIYMPETITHLYTPFEGCYKLANWHIPNLSWVCGVVYMSGSAANPLYYSGQRNIDTKIYINGQLLTDLVIPADMEMKSSYIFQYCKSITSVKLLSNQTKLKSWFLGCSNMTRIELPQSITEIDSTAFYNCTSLELIDFRGATGVPTLSSTNAFNQVPSTCKIVIPDSLYDTWTNATNWSAINVTWVKESEYVE